MLDPDGVNRTKALGSDRMARRLNDALAGGNNPLRRAVWEPLGPMLSATLASLTRDAFVTDGGVQTTVDLASHRASSDLVELELGGEQGLGAQ